MRWDGVRGLPAFGERDGLTSQFNDFSGELSGYIRGKSESAQPDPCAKLREQVERLIGQKIDLEKQLTQTRQHLHDANQTVENCVETARRQSGEKLALHLILCQAAENVRNPPMCGERSRSPLSSTASVVNSLASNGEKPNHHSRIPAPSSAMKWSGCSLRTPISGRN
jgi:hypothetical protein